MSPADRQTVEDLFKNPEKAVPPPRGAADFFSYCITRQSAAGPEMVKVHVDAVPKVLKESVRDVIE